MNLEWICLRWLEAAFNGTLEGIFLTVLVAGILRGFPRTNAATRHAVWFLTLLCVTSLPWFQGLRAIRGPRGTPGVVFAKETPGVPTPGVQWAVADPVDPDSMRSGPKALDRPEVEVSAWGGGPDGWSPPEVDSGVLNGVAEPVPEAHRTWTIEVPPGVPVAMLGAWVLLAMFRVTRLIRELGWVCRLKARSVPAGAEAQRLFEGLAESMGVGRRIRLCVGPEDGTPLLAGFFDASVIVPAGFLEAGSRESVAQVLRHELGHARRFDDWSNLIQQVIAAVCFFHPAVHWISRRLALDREIACDDHVLDAESGVRSYALLLTHFAGRRPGREWIAAPAVWSRNTELKERIAMILNPKRNASPRISGATVGILLIVTAGLSGALLHAGPRVEVSGSGVGGEEPQLAAAAVTDPTNGGDAQAIPAESRSNSANEVRSLPSDPKGPVESDLLPEASPRKARASKNGKSLGRANEKYLGEMNPADSVEERLARLERILEEMKSSLKNRAVEVQRKTRSPDVTQDLQRVEAEKQVVEVQRRNQAATLARVGANASRKFQEGARKDAERELELVRKFNGDLIIGRIGSSDGDLLAKTGRLDLERRELEVMRQALEKELKKINERIVSLDERQQGNAVESDAKGSKSGEAGAHQSEIPEKDSSGASSSGR